MNNEVVIVGINLGKNWFHTIGMDRIGRIVVRRRLNRRSFCLDRRPSKRGSLPRCIGRRCPREQRRGRTCLAVRVEK